MIISQKDLIRKLKYRRSVAKIPSNAPKPSSGLSMNRKRRSDNTLHKTAIKIGKLGSMTKLHNIAEVKDEKLNQKSKVDMKYPKSRSKYDSLIVI